MDIKDKEKEIKDKLHDKNRNVYDEVFKMLFFDNNIATNFIQSSRLFDEKAQIEIKKVYNELDEKYKIGKKEQDISILTNIKDIITIDANIKKEKALEVIFMIEVQKEKSYNMPIRLKTYSGLVLEQISKDITGVDLGSSSKISHKQYKEILGKIPILIPVLINLDKKGYNYVDKKKQKDQIFKIKDYKSVYGITTNEILENFNFKWIETNIVDWKEEEKFNQALKKLSHNFSIYGGEKLRREIIKMAQEELSIATQLINLGKEEGRQEGRQEGEKIGIEKGAKENTLNIAANMLKKGMDINLIKELTGLSMSQIRSIML